MTKLTTGDNTHEPIQSDCTPEVTPKHKPHKIRAECDPLAKKKTKIAKLKGRKDRHMEKDEMEVDLPEPMDVDDIEMDGM